MAENGNARGGRAGARSRTWTPRVIAGDANGTSGTRLSAAVWAARAGVLATQWRRWEATARRRGREEVAATLGRCVGDLETAVADATGNLVLLDELRDALVADVRRVVRNELARTGRAALEDRT